uniref:Transmembrane protein n=1 Tax=Iridovirus LCIVAC01 TaxID=2506607 RepID=A0A481YQ85_9VIRU|nr:MAG: hypothetical protein LCIVAC01_01570 [Iridovirus LCIVAC01]
MNLQLVQTLFLLFVISKTTANADAPSDPASCLSILAKECHPDPFYWEGVPIEGLACAAYQDSGGGCSNSIAQYFSAVDDYNNCIKTNNTCNCIDYQTELINAISWIPSFKSKDNKTIIGVECLPQYIKEFCSTPFFIPEMYANAMIYIHSMNNGIVLEKEPLPMLCSEKDCSNAFISFWKNRDTYYYNNQQTTLPVFENFAEAIIYARIIANKKFCINKGQTISAFGINPHNEDFEQYPPFMAAGTKQYLCFDNLDYCPTDFCAIPYPNQTFTKAIKEAEQKIYECGKISSSSKSKPSSKSSSKSSSIYSIIGGTAVILVVAYFIYSRCKKKRNSELRQNLLLNNDRII